jgi:hypothetical protein
MASLSSSRTALNVGFFLGRSLTLQIIPSGTYAAPFGSAIFNFFFFSVMLATIRTNGKRPCPQCFIEKDQIEQLGTALDHIRSRRSRKDTAKRRMKVELTRTFIFADGMKLDSATVEAFLAPNSWVPTRVSHFVSKCRQ